MPGLIVFRRRWSVGSDDMVVPGVFLFTMHLIWTIVLSVILYVVHFDRSVLCVKLLWEFVIGYLAILVISLATELSISIVATRGGILDTEPRRSMQYILYFRLVILLCETGWLIAGIVWLVKFYTTCQIDRAKETVLGLVVCNWCILLSILITVWCTYDSAGRSWVKMKNYQMSMKQSESKYQYKRSGSTRNWRQRKVLRAYQDSWDHRCRFLFCCMRPSDRNRNSFADIARLLSDFFRDLDVVPSDVVAGLVLLRKFQKIERRTIVVQRKNDTYEFLSGVPITPRTHFLSLHEGADLELFQAVIHFAHYALRAYGWPMYLMTETCASCRLCGDISCCCFSCRKQKHAEIVEDNCCDCHLASLKKLSDVGDIEIVYATFHVDVGETPFFIAVDYDRKKVVISIRGTLSMKDILTDLNAEAETIPLIPPQEEWMAHKGMVQAAQYILEKLKAEKLLERAFDFKPERGTREFKVVVVGHSLGAGTASILGIMLRKEFQDLKCYCYSPPGGLLSASAVEYSKSFTISVVLGKDVVPRIGLNQMEALRADLINAIKRSVDSKWKIITCSVMCCCCGTEPTSATELAKRESAIMEYMNSKTQVRALGNVRHPSDSSIALTSHQPLYPPGRIIHVVRHHPKKGEQAFSSKEPVYQALWAENTDFDEVLISPVMIQDHMPDKVVEALSKVVRYLGPRKPQRSSSSVIHNSIDECSLIEPQGSSSPTRRFCLETSFTSLQSPSICPSNASSITNGYYPQTQEPFLKVDSIVSALKDKLKGGARGTEKTTKPALSLDLPQKHVDMVEKRHSSLDLIHDDWFGLAPLASPESMSEISSISSRASFVTNVDVRIELRTPKMMRRTPKIHGNLSTCADDEKSVKEFKKYSLTANWLHPQAVSSSSTNSSSNLSFESASSKNGEHFVDVSKCCWRREPEQKIEQKFSVPSESDEFQSAEDIIDNVIATAGCTEFFKSKPAFLETHFDDIIFSECTISDKTELTKEPSASSTVKIDLESSGYALIVPTSTPLNLESSSTRPTSGQRSYQSSPQVLSPSSPHDDPDMISNFAIDLTLDEEHRSPQFNQMLGETTHSSKQTSIDSGSMCRTPMENKNVTFSPEVININQALLLRGLSEKKKDKKRTKKLDKWSLLPGRHKSAKKAEVIPKAQETPKSVTGPKKEESGECFSRTEGLPLLSGLSSVSVEKSPSFVRRKKYVYPTITTYENRGESSV